MKYLEDAQLSQLTSELTTAILPGTNRRVLNGRIEAYITKRAGTDKKIASELNDRYVSELERNQWETEEWRKRVLGWQQQQQQKQHQSKGQGQGQEEKTDDSEQQSEKDGGEKEEGNGGGGILLAGTVRASSEKSDEFAAAKERKRDAKRQRRRRTRSVGSEPDSILRPPGRSSRSRSASFDVASAREAAAAASASLAPGDRLLRSISDATRSTPLGDFHETSTRRLLTDLILTLNASFPDYDFSDAKPSHFAKIPTVKVAWNRIVERLSEYAAFRSSSGVDGIHSNSVGGGGTGGRGSGGRRSKSSRNSGSGVGSSGGSGFLSQLYAALDDVASLIDCDVYSYAPPPEAAGDGGTDDDEIDPLGFLAQTLAAEEMEVMEDGDGGGEGDGRISGGLVGSAVVSAEERDVDGDVVLLDGTGGVDGAAAPTVGSQRKRHHADGDVDVDGIVTPVDATATTGIVRRSARSTPSVVPLWSFNYFFVNRSLKRIVLFAAVLTMTNDAGRIDIDEEDDFVADVTAGATTGNVAVRGDGGAMMSSIAVEDVSHSASGEVGVAGAMMGVDDEDGFGVDTPMKGFGGAGGGGERGSGAYDASSLSGYYSIDTEHSSVAASEEGGTFDMDESGTGPGTMGGSVPPPHPPIGAT